MHLVDWGLMKQPFMYISLAHTILQQGLRFDTTSTAKKDWTKSVKNILNIFVPCCTGLGRGDKEIREERENTIETGKRSFSLS